MSRFTLFGIVSTFALLAFAFVPGTQADARGGGAWDLKTIVTFHQPVEVPGKVLPAGTYIFRTMDSYELPQVVQIFNPDKKHVEGTFLTRPVYVLHAPATAAITFEERPGESQEAVKTWWYPGDQYGHQFIYR